MNIDIFKNFTELTDKKNFDKKEQEKYKKLFLHFPLTEEEFYSKIDINPLSIDEEGREGIKKIDIFIKKILNFYTIIYCTNVILDNKNYYRDTKIHNDVQTKYAKKCYAKGQICESVEYLLSKKYRKDSLKNFNFSNNIEKKLYYKVVSKVDTQIVISDISKKLECKIEKELYDFLLEDEIKFLAKIISFEIYFRAKKPKKYCPNYIEIKKEYIILEQMMENYYVEKALKISDNENDFQLFLKKFSDIIKK